MFDRRSERKPGVVVTLEIIKHYNISSYTQCPSRRIHWVRCGIHIVKTMFVLHHLTEIQYCGEFPRTRDSMLGLRPSGSEFQPD